MVCRMTSFFLFMLLITCCTDTVYSHTSISSPIPISYVNTCRVGNRVHCPGPCPNQLFRPNKSIKIVRRGGLLRVRTKKNNHFGGFARWSIVKVKDMWKKHKHNRGAFLYTCHDLRLRHCTYRNREWCAGDKKNQYYTHKFRIPKVYPDGDYILGFAWYGGLFSTKDFGDFGDYYDCAYIRIRGGGRKRKHWPEFRAGPSVTGKKGYCSATVDKLGTCWKEPCRVNNKARIALMLKPHEFAKGRRPSPIRNRDFK